MHHFFIHDFLNSTPLTFPVESDRFNVDFSLKYLSPSDIGAKIKTEENFSGIVPSITLNSLSDISIIDSFCIASKSSVKTVCFYSSKSLEEVKTVYLDTRSKTSHAMLRIIFQLLGEAENKTFQKGLFDKKTKVGSDEGFLIIGDDNFYLENELSAYIKYDLGKIWHDLTGCKFVHAVTITTDRNLVNSLQESLRNCLNYSFDNFEEMLDFASKRYHLDKSLCAGYLRDTIHYQLDGEAKEGLNTFLGYAKKFDL